MAQYKVLKDFDYAHDGVTVKHLSKGDTPHIRDLVAAGLKAEGFIADLDPKAAAKAAAAAPAEPAPEGDAAPQPAAQK